MRLYTLAITHRHGRDIYVFDDEERMLDALDAYVRAWWSTELRDEPMPEEPSQRIQHYFERMEGEEYYETDEARLNAGPNTTPDDSGAVWPTADMNKQPRA